MNDPKTFFWIAAFVAHATAVDPNVIETLLDNAHPTTRRRGNVVTTSLCTSQWRRKYVSNETPNDVSMERR